MPNVDVPAFPHPAALIDAVATADAAERIYAADRQFEVNGYRYRLDYGEQGPTVTRVGPRKRFSDIFRTRMANGGKTCADTMQSGIRANRRALRHCVSLELARWRDGGPNADGRAEAMGRVLACFDGRKPELDLHGLELTSVPHVVEALRIHLRALRLGNNRLISMPPVAAQLVQLHVLELQGNAIDQLPGWLTTLTQLRVLSLNDNRLREWPRAVETLPKLAFLWLERNGIVEIPLNPPSHPPSFEVFAAGNPIPSGASRFFASGHRGRAFTVAAATSFLRRSRKGTLRMPATATAGWSSSCTMRPRGSPPHRSFRTRFFRTTTAAVRTTSMRCLLPSASTSPRRKTRRFAVLPSWRTVWSCWPAICAMTPRPGKFV